MSYTAARARGLVAQTATKVAKQFASNYVSVADAMGVPASDLVLPLELRGTSVTLDLKFTEFAEYLGEMVDNVRSSEDDEAAEAAAVVLSEMQSIAVRGIES